MISRRNVLQCLAPTLAGMTVAGTATAQQTSGSSMLVACFTRTGNSRVVAERVWVALSTDYFAIEPAEPYPADYDETVAQASRERESGFLPRPVALIANPAQYRQIFLAFPIWGMSPPPIIRSFLAAHDLSGTIIQPLITHGGYGIGGSMDVLAEYAPGADFRQPFTLECDQERRTLDAVNAWLETSST